MSIHLKIPVQDQAVQIIVELVADETAHHGKANGAGKRKPGMKTEAVLRDLRQLLAYHRGPFRKLCHARPVPEVVPFELHLRDGLPGRSALQPVNSDPAKILPLPGDRPNSPILIQNLRKIPTFTDTLVDSALFRNSVLA